MQAVMYNPYMRLPVEIVRMIIEEGAGISPAVALKLLTLSSSTKKWVELIIYRRIVISSPTQFRRFVASMLSDISKQYRLAQLNLNELQKEFRESPTAFRRCSLIRHLWIIPPMKPYFVDILMPLVIHMPNLVHLALDPCNALGYYPVIDMLAPHIPVNWRLRRLTIIHSGKPEDALSSNVLDLFLPLLTHLHVVSPGPAIYERFDGSPERGVLPRIEHLAFDITASYTDSLHCIQIEDMMPLRTIREGELVPLGFNGMESEVRDIFIRAERDVPDDQLNQLKERVRNDPRITLIQAPEMPCPNIRFFDVLDKWQKKVYRALEDVAERWR